MIIPDFHNLKDELWWKMCDYEMSIPLPLEQYDFEEYPSWIYDRRYGVFFSPFASHQHALCLLSAWDQGYEDPFEVPEPEWASKFNYLPYEMADRFLINTPGTCFLSGQEGSEVIAGKKGNLNEIELDYFYPVTYIE